MAKIRKSRIKDFLRTNPPSVFCHLIVHNTFERSQYLLSRSKQKGQNHIGRNFPQMLNSIETLTNMKKKKASRSLMLYKLYEIVFFLCPFSCHNLCCCCCERASWLDSMLWKINKIGHFSNKDHHHLSNNALRPSSRYYDKYNTSTGQRSHKELNFWKKYLNICDK